MRYLKADFIFPISSAAIKNGIVVVNKDGSIVDLLDELHPNYGVALAKSVHYSGFICPGFINTHCHLELSYLKEKIDENTGLDVFIKQIEQVRKNTDPKIIVQKAIEAEEEMLNNGTVAVGDISNSNISFEIKNKKKLHYHTFIEAYAFHPERADAAWEKALGFYNEYVDSFNDNMLVSIVPHAPYSVSKKLLDFINIFAKENNSILSIHNQENKDEDLLFREKRGSILERLKSFGIDTSFFNATGKSALPSIIYHLKDAKKVLLVHNTYTTKEDLAWLQKNKKNLPELFWCFCPNANKYIENRIPNIEIFLTQEKNLTIGTDSYASNWALSVLDELKTISNVFPKISIDSLLTWATANGAKFLGIEHTFGSIEKNKKPGLLWIKNVDVENRKLLNESSSERII